MTTLNDVVDDAVDSHPAPSAQAPQIVSGVISGGATCDTPAVAGGAAVTDRTGAPHDPALHASPPRITARGTWAKRRSVNDGGQSPAEALRAVDSPGIAPDGPRPINHRAIAETWGTRFFSFAQVAFGDEWKPSPAEHDDVVGSLERYMIATGWTVDLPPGWALIAAIATYALPKFLSGGINGGFVGKLIEKRRAAIEESDATVDEPQERMAA